MATITLEPDQALGLHYVFHRELEMACDAVDIDQLRKLVALGDQIGWLGDPEAQALSEEPSDAIEVECPDELLAKFTDEAQRGGRDIMAGVYQFRAEPYAPYQRQSERDERNARSMIAFAEAHGQAVAA